MSSSLRARTVRLVLPALLALALAPASGHANATVSQVDSGGGMGADSLLVTGTAAADQIFLEEGDAGMIRIAVSSMGETITATPSSGCTPFMMTTFTLECDLTNVSLVEVRAGDGNDTIQGGAWDATIRTDLNGEAGNDTFNQTETSLGPDEMDGGLGDDTISYEVADAGVQIRVNDTLRNEGRGCRTGSAYVPVDVGPCEGDYILNTSETYVGSDHDDIIIGFASSETLRGGPGDDHLDAGVGYDVVSGGTGLDYVFGGADEDVVDERDGEVDGLIDCGTEVDRVYFDATPVVDVAPNVNCEIRNAPRSTVVPAAPTPGAVIGTELTSSNGTWDVDASAPIFAYAYRWQRCSADLTSCANVTEPDGSGDARYTPVVADVGTRLRLRVTAQNSNGNTQAYSAASTVVPAPALGATVRPAAPRGVPARGFEVSSDHGTWDGVGSVSYEYRWQRCGSSCLDIAGADAADETYQVTTDDVGFKLRLQVTATDDQTTVSDTSDKSATVPEPPQNTDFPSGPFGVFRIDGVLEVGQGSWGNVGAGTTYATQWYRCDPLCNTEVRDERGDLVTSRGYKLTRADVSHELFVRVRATDPAHGITDAFSALTPKIADYTAPSGGLVGFDGPMRVGRKLTAKATFDGDVTESQVRYEWRLCEYEEPLATCAARATVSTSNQYTIQELDFGRQLLVDAIARNTVGERRQSTLQARILRDVSPNCAGLDPNGDPDGDRLKTSVECWTLTAGPKDGTLDLGQLGADPLHKDIFVEVDYMKGHGIMDTAVERVQRSFAAAPVNNPDGTTGINMHIDNGPTTPIGIGNDKRQWGFMSDSRQVTHYTRLGSFIDGKYDWSPLDKYKNEFRWQAPIRRYAFHYLVAAHRYGADDNTSTGIARAADFKVANLGQDFIMTMGAYNTNDKVHDPGSENAQVGTFMHELGHLLGLGHGGRRPGAADLQNYKPNHPSVMNYSWQLTGVKKTDGSFAFDYSRYGSDDLNTIDEGDLDEKLGIKARNGAQDFMVQRSCLTTYVVGSSTGSTTQRLVARSTRKPGALDWNCSNGGSGVDSAHVKYDVNREPTTAKEPLSNEHFDVLKPSDDWANLVYSGGAIGAAGAGGGASSADGGATGVIVEEEQFTAPRLTPNLDEDSTPEQLLPSVQAATGDTASPRITIGPARKVRSKRRFRLVVTDNRALAYTTVRIGRRLAFQSSERGRSAQRAITIPSGRHVVVVTARDEVGNTRTVRKVLVVR